MLNTLIVEICNEHITIFGNSNAAGGANLAGVGKLFVA